ncbi:sodium-dependent serotonin transporter [Plakobranchus ocellatus]|uniref:Sodium-dependent serotonin transporter n=1 Tax=Plakobranchus ocellatus TaxID=259542 RepID=A0AAV4AYV8_9GAST|nr:sodium-dependent serotonin transporter [Plakobranchus ocellatus]
MTKRKQLQSQKQHLFLPRRNILCQSKPSCEDDFAHSAADKLLASPCGLFFLAYYILLLLVCLPVCYVQIKLGAMYRRGMVGIFSHIVPILKGVAAALLIMTYFRSITHALEISYGVHYMVVSCLQPFPWTGKPELNISTQEAKITIFDNIKTNPEDRYFICHRLSYACPDISKPMSCGSMTGLVAKA